MEEWSPEPVGHETLPAINAVHEQFWQQMIDDMAIPPHLLGEPGDFNCAASRVAEEMFCRRFGITPPLAAAPRTPSAAGS